MNNRKFAVCGIVLIDEKVMLVRHTYGTAKDRILLPGGYVKDGELPDVAAVREIYEETSVKVKANYIAAFRFKPEEWCAVFVMDYIGGTPRSDNYENNEVILLAPEEAVKRPDITNMSREILNSYIGGSLGKLEYSSYCPKSSSSDNFRMYGIK